MTASAIQWGEHTVEGKLAAEWTAGDLQLRAKAEEDEIWISGKYPAHPSSGKQQAEWSRWALKKPSPSLNIVPVFPDRSVVVQPENPFWLLPGVQVRVYVRVPIWVSLRLPARENRLLAELPSVVLSLTWFGTPTEGELCYWISSSARRTPASDNGQEHLAICPLQLKNTSNEDLSVQKICLRVKWLALFERDGRLWSNETKVQFRGAADASHVQVQSGPPGEAAGAELISPAREGFKRGSVLRTFFEL